MGQNCCHGQVLKTAEDTSWPATNSLPFLVGEAADVHSNQPRLSEKYMGSNDIPSDKQHKYKQLRQ